nr:MFS transporter [Nakamurella flavida]
MFSTGWAANHFAALLPALRAAEGLSPSLLAGVYGLYAVGLLPGLLLAGSLSDRIGRARTAVPGAVVALSGTVLLAAWHEPAGLVAGRLIVGLGAGATFSAGTAWAADLGGPSGATRAGVALTGGFAFGPVVSGVLAQWGPAPLALPFLLSAALSAAAVVAVLAVTVRAPRHPVTDHAEHRVLVGTASGAPAGPRRSARTALGWALPIAPWVFAGATVGVVTLPARMAGTTGGPLLAGAAAGAVLGTGIVVQALARRLRWGPGAGSAGALSAAAGLALAAVGGGAPTLPLVLVAFVLLGTGYGLCLRAGLVDLTTYSPAAVRGTLTGAFYVATYLGFGVPIALEALRPSVGDRLPLVVLAVAAVAVASIRWWRLRGRAARADGRQ